MIGDIAREYQSLSWLNRIIYYVTSENISHQSYFLRLPTVDPASAGIHPLLPVAANGIFRFSMLLIAWRCADSNAGRGAVSSMLRRKPKNLRAGRKSGVGRISTFGARFRDVQSAPSFSDVRRREQPTFFHKKTRPS